MATWRLVERATELVKKITYVQFGNAGDFVEKMHAAQFLPYTDLDEYPSVREKLKKRKVKEKQISAGTIGSGADHKKRAQH